MLTKVCPTCNQTKEVNSDNFIRSKMHDADGFSSECRSCHVQKFLKEEHALYGTSPNYNRLSKTTKRKQASRSKSLKQLAIDKLLHQGLKECSHCHEVKSVSEFGLNENTYSGLNSRCKQCATAIAKEYRTKKKIKETDDNRDSCST